MMCTQSRSSNLTQAADPLQVAYVRHLSRMACQQPHNMVLCLFLGVHRSPCMVLNAVAHQCVLPEAFCEHFPMVCDACAGDKSASAMGTIRPRTPTKAALTARAHALKRSRVAQHQQMDLERKIQAELVASAAAARLPPPSNLQVNLLLSGLCLWQEKKRKEKTMPFGVNVMRSPVLYRAAQACVCDMPNLLRCSTQSGLPQQ